MKDRKVGGLGKGEGGIIPIERKRETGRKKRREEFDCMMCM